MCMAQPVEQKTPTEPAPYSLDKAWMNVTSNTVTPDGKTHGGWTVGQQGDANQAAYGQREVPSNQYSGPNYSM